MREIEVLCSFDLALLFKILGVTFRRSTTFSRSSFRRDHFLSFFNIRGSLFIFERSLFDQANFFNIAKLFFNFLGPQPFSI